MAVKWVNVSGQQRHRQAFRRRDGIKHEIKLHLMRFNHERIAKRLASGEGFELSPTVDRRKLEEAYYKISNDYVWVLRKK